MGHTFLQKSKGQYIGTLAPSNCGLFRRQHPSPPSFDIPTAPTPTPFPPCAYFFDEHVRVCNSVFFFSFPPLRTIHGRGFGYGYLRSTAASMLAPMMQAVVVKPAKVG